MNEPIEITGIGFVLSPIPPDVLKAQKEIMDSAVLPPRDIKDYPDRKWHICSIYSNGETSLGSLRCEDINEARSILLKVASLTNNKDGFLFFVYKDKELVEGYRYNAIEDDPDDKTSIT